MSVSLSSDTGVLVGYIRDLADGKNRSGSSVSSALANIGRSTQSCVQRALRIPGVQGREPAALSPSDVSRLVGGRRLDDVARQTCQDLERALGAIDDLCAQAERRLAVALRPGSTAPPSGTASASGLGARIADAGRLLVQLHAVVGVAPQLMTTRAPTSGVVATLKKIGKAIYDDAIDWPAEAVGELERLGLRYSVTTYEKRVDGGLYRGSRVTPAQMAKLKDNGIRGIVNLCLENNDDAAPAAALGLQALHIPILDNSAPSFGQAGQFLGFCKQVRPVYVHCEAGKGRTGTMVAVYRMAVDRWTVDAALAEYKSFIGLCLPDQVNFIQAFGAALKK
jgi:hypothetical protein